MTDEKDVGFVLKRAIKGERDGYFFYNLLAEKATNKDAKRKLENLRDDEIRHEKTLIDIYQRMVGGEVGELPEKGINALAEVFRRGHLEERKTEQEFISLAIEAELAATKFYQEQETATDDPEFRAIFKALADEEYLHFQLLQAEKDALAGNYSWFGYDESSPLEH
jgi:rubrerythrin